MVCGGKCRGLRWIDGWMEGSGRWYRKAGGLAM